MDFGGRDGFDGGCFPFGGFFGGSFIWIIILLCICNGEFFDGFGCGCRRKRRRKKDCCFGFGNNWWIWIIIFFIFFCRPGFGQVCCIPQHDDCC